MALYFHRITAVALPVNPLDRATARHPLLPSAILTLLTVLIVPAVAFVPAAATAACCTQYFGPYLFADSMTGICAYPPPMVAIVTWFRNSNRDIFRPLAQIRNRRSMRLARLSCRRRDPAASRALSSRGTLEVTTIDVGQATPPPDHARRKDVAGRRRRHRSASPDAKFDIGRTLSRRYCGLAVSASSTR